MIVLLVAAGAAVGAPARYLVDRSVQSWHGTVFPWGTLAVNVAAALILGIITGGSGVNAELAALLGTGFCGSLSTFSTFSYETMRLGRQGGRLLAIANVAISLVAGLGAAALGWWLGSTLG